MDTAHPRSQDGATAPVLQPVIQEVVEAAPEELNQWKRGFTPQAEIWNGRMAMVGLSVGLTVLLIARLSGHV
ncbi:MAG: high light inducible protein [Cyanobium sp.]